jgi:heterodisulfide reductase subunit B2
VAKLSGKVVKDAVKRGAEAIVVACPMCHANLDMRRNVINEFMGEKYTIPVLYVSQAIGLALGLNEKALGLHRHIVKVKFSDKPKEVKEEKKPKAPVKADTDSSEETMEAQ